MSENSGGPSIAESDGARDEGDERQGFEEEYRAWALAMGKEAGERLSALPSGRQERVLQMYRRYMDPLTVFSRANARTSRLAGERGRSFVLVETGGVAFFPSIYSGIPGGVDFAVAMNRRFYVKGLWFPIIALNSEYVRRSDDKILAFTLEHEFEMSRIYQEISMNMRPLSPGEKKDVVDSAGRISAERLQMTPEELIVDERLMTKISMTEPLIPKPYAELALLSYIEEHLKELRPLGQEGASPEEDDFGGELYEEFTSWSEFSKETYGLFVREVAATLRDAGRSYG